MSNAIIAVLVVTNLATGFDLYRHREMYQRAVSDKTTSYEREVFGASCLDWLNEKAKEHGIEMVMGRSWKKHGQMVFELFADPDIDRKLIVEKISPDWLPAVLCTYDRQSGTMYTVAGKDRDKWMFYE